MSEAKPLDGRVILVVGATGGLGEAASVACARAGATVILLGRNVRKLNKTYDAVHAMGPEPLAYPLDLEGASPDDYLELAERIDGELGRLDGIVHCAAHFRTLTPLDLTDPADLARALHINVTAPMWLTSACLPLLERQTEAGIVIALDGDTVGKPFWGGYGVSQAARAALVGTWAREMPQGPAHVVGFNPGPMRTGLRAKSMVEDVDGRTCPPDAYAADVVRLLGGEGKAHHGEVVRVQADVALYPKPKATPEAGSVVLPLHPGSA